MLIQFVAPGRPHPGWPYRVAAAVPIILGALCGS
jgi:hypothetical protein